MQEFSHLKTEIKRLKAHLQALTSAPARRRVTGTTMVAQEDQRRIICDHTQVGDSSPATLYPRPRFLTQLWDEWMIGLEGRKPARKFTAYERGQVKAKYCQRKPFWLLMERLIKGRRYTATAALNKIAQVYHGNITTILKRIRVDENKGGHHLLHPFRVERRHRHHRSRRQLLLSYKIH